MKSRSKNIRQLYQILVTCHGFEYKEVKKNMKVFKLKKWLCGIVMMFALVFITSQATFAVDENTTDLSAVAQAGEQNITSSNQGEVGIARNRIPSKIKKGLRELDKAANVIAPGSVQLYAAFTSDTAADPEVGDVTIVPVLDDTDAYLYVAFRVTAPMTVDIKWMLDGATVHKEPDFKDPVTKGDLSQWYWYFAWYKPASITPDGLHTSDIFVKKHGQLSADNETDSCKFTVLAYLVP